MFVHFTLILGLYCVAVHAQTTTSTSTPATFGCLDESSSSKVTGNYSKYTDWKNHSIWIKDTIGETYVVYFDDSIGANSWKGFGFYKCTSARDYTDAIDQMTEKSPVGVMNCEGIPTIFCPSLSEDDATSLSDGMGTTDGSLDWIYIEHFYDCQYWYNYDEGTMYPSPATMSFEADTVCVSSDGNSDNNDDNDVITPGDKTHTQTDADAKAKMSSSQAAILWSILSIFILICIAAISYFVYRWREKQRTQQSSEQNVGLTNEAEEDKFDRKDTNNNELLEEENQVAV
mmetsp:Transcript_45675/g.73101  ORF Transcript_45675/g.73101 Transcript_45675/m.73101 type:complete len:287 (-) Transcript_45675:121-981(-)|eukprot:CAMPEP_0197076500 /NCGR_PEP_ID=MMETSP1384-20130603/212144_1 /TAXON_ID=29189 /ORGANISM="Ammonia sp." /LENGTH=286 /DNA_ID=CAMNT_0042515357 /DNA_START=996 /DNA_END=1856 /DNA_ORIENTATION=-